MVKAFSPTLLTRLLGRQAGREASGHSQRNRGPRAPPGVYFWSCAPPPTPGLEAFSVVKQWKMVTGLGFHLLDVICPNQWLSPCLPSSSPQLGPLVPPQWPPRPLVHSKTTTLALHPAISLCQGSVAWPGRPGPHDTPGIAVMAKQM